ncbi:uncharacterized protein PAF06_020198 [Gastrophryne carolinensis]
MAWPLFLLAAVLLILYKKIFVRRGNLPPGPTPLPVLGNLLHLKSRETHRPLLELSKKYGPVYTLYIGSQPAVVLCGYKAVKEALVDHGDKFSGRAEVPVVELTSRGYGIAFSNGQRWKELRRFSLTTLRNFGMGKRSIEERIQEEVLHLLEIFQETQGSFFSPAFFIRRSVSNVICSVIFGNRFEYTDSKLQILLDLVAENLRRVDNFWVQIYNFIPSILKHLPGPHHKLTENYQAQLDYAEEIVREHEKTLDPSSPRDYIDAFLLKMKQESENPETEYNLPNLLSCALDIFFAGQETVSSTLSYTLLILMKYPHIKEKVQAEIENVIGRTRRPCMEDRANMPYTDAVMHEVMRFIDFLPLGAPHAVTEDTVFRGYNLPKGTIVFPVLHSVLYDNSLFERPQEFYPEHFLCQSGGFKRNEGFMAFSAGKRACPGESLARMELFLYLTSILQKFDICPDKTPDEIDLSPEYSGLGKKAPTFQMSFIPYRHKKRVLAPWHNHRNTERLGEDMWLSSALLFILLLCMVCITWLKSYKKRLLLPPGPPPLPLIGNVLQVKPKEMLVSLKKFQEKFGPVFTVYFGTRPAVMLCGYDAVKEALVDQKDEFGARGKIPMAEYVLNGYGITASNGERWKQLRRFILTTLRNFGMGKRSIEERIQEEAQFLMEEFNKTKGKPFDPTFFLSCAVSNIICSIVFGKRFDYNDESFLALLRNITGLIRFMNSGWGLAFYYFERLMRFVPGPLKQGAQCLLELKSFVQERVEKSRKKLDPQSPQHFIDCFLIKMQQDKENPETEFSMENLVASTINLFVAGTETVSTTLRYGFLILLKYPEIQVKIQNEIDQNIGHQCPSAEDRTKLPYTEAVIYEIQRFSNVIPTGLPHSTTEDVSFRGYVIPKGTDVFPLLTATLNDPTHFPNPEEFSPARFLDENGALKKSPALLPFSAGKRMCPGEGLARMELFLFITTLLQKFTFTSTVAKESLDLKAEASSAGHVPQFYKMCAIPRSSTLSLCTSN